MYSTGISFCLWGHSNAGEKLFGTDGRDRKIPYSGLSDKNLPCKFDDLRTTSRTSWTTLNYMTTLSTFDLLLNVEMRF